MSLNSLPVNANVRRDAVPLDTSYDGISALPLVMVLIAFARLSKFCAAGNVPPLADTAL